MILEETLNKLVRDIIDLSLASPGYSIKAKQDAPRPVTPYASVDFMSESREGWESRKFTDNVGDSDLTETITGLRRIMFSVDFYKSDARDNARRVRTRLIRESIQSLMRAANVGYIGVSDVRELSEALTEGWEERAQFDLTLSVVGADSDIVNSILSVDIEGAYLARGLDYTIDIEVTQ